MTFEPALGTVTLAYRQSGSGPDIVWLAAGDNPETAWGLGHGSAFGHRPDVVNACLRAIVDRYA